MPRLRLMLGSWYRILHMRKCMQPTERNQQINKNRYGSLSILGYAIKKNNPRPEAWSIKASGFFHKARDILRKAKLQRMVHAQLFLSDVKKIKVIDWGRVYRRKNYTIGRTCPWRPFLSSHTWRKEPMAKQMEYALKWRRKTRTDESATWLSWCEAFLSSTLHWRSWKNLLRQDIEEGQEHRSDLQGASDEPNSAEQREQSNWKQAGFLEFLEASFTVIMFKKDKNWATSSFPIPLKYIDVVRRTNTTLDVLQELSGDGNVHGDRQLSGPCTTSRRHVVRVEMDKDYVARKLVRNGKEIPAKRKTTMGRRRAKARQCTQAEKNLFHRSGRQGIL